MPVNNPGSLSNETAVSVVAYLLKNNGAAAGTAAFTPTTAVAINTITPARRRSRRGRTAGRPRTARLRLRFRRSAQRRCRAAPRRRPFRTGITVPGTVAKYTPVTEEMMLHPPAADWLMHYQNYAGWSHSPLKQINAKNVQNLQLRWVWSHGRWRTPADHAPGA